VDFGGCRCQAFLITGDAALTDPVCTLSPHRHLVDAAVAAAAAAGQAERVSDQWTYRAAPASRRLAAKG
jgi:pyrroloquinoline quinone biosynthesis protein E